MDNYRALKDSPHRLGPIYIRNDDYIEFKCHSDIYGITMAAGSIKTARKIGAINCGDGSYYMFDKYDWLEIDTGKYYDNWEKIIAAMELENDNTILLNPVNVDDATIKMLRTQLKLTTVPFKWYNNRFRFARPVWYYFNELKANGKIFNIRQDLQYFGTPNKIGRYMIDTIKPSGKNCLEPSAGMGGIAKFMPHGTTAIELHKPYCEVLKKHYSHLDVVCGDFLDMDFDRKFDYIIANPPFNKGRWRLHFTKMTDLLSDTGKLACILPAAAESWVKRNYPAANIENLDGKAFAYQASNQKGTSTPIMLVILKPIIG